MFEFHILLKSIFNFTEINDFDVVLALNVFHHLVKDEFLYKKLTEFLNRIKMKEMYLQIPNLKDVPLNQIYRNYSPEEFVQYVLDNSCLNKAELILNEKAEKSRKLFKIKL